MLKNFWKIFLVVMVIVIAFTFPAIVTSIATWAQGAGFAGAVAATTSVLAALPVWAGAVVGLGLAYLLDPETTSEVIGDVGKAAGNVAAAVGSAVAGGLSSIWGLLAAGGLAWWLWTSGSEKKNEAVEGSTS